MTAAESHSEVTTCPDEPKNIPESVDIPPEDDSAKAKEADQSTPDELEDGGASAFAVVGPGGGPMDSCFMRGVGQPQNMMFQPMMNPFPM